jgi:hypothetical protein
MVGKMEGEGIGKRRYLAVNSRSLDIEIFIFTDKKCGLVCKL